MPYEIAGNAAGIDPNTLMNPNVQRSDYGGHRGGGGQKGCDIKGCFCFLIVGGLICLAMGAVRLKDALHDTRGDELGSWNAAMKTWDTTGLASFKALEYQVGTPSGATPLTAASGTYTPANFGESSWNNKKYSTPSPQTTYNYKGTAQCPGAVNQPCSITLTAKNNKTITRNLNNGPWQQQQQRRSDEGRGCQWYDGDYNHPMATIGMGGCNTQGPNFGPSCVDDIYLDQNGCPNDLLVESYWGTPSFNMPWATYYVNKPRFTYEQTSTGGKCWDYTDCFCQGCGNTFKTDTTKGYGFTGFGYYYNGIWYPFAKPFASMSGTEKAQQCQKTFTQIGLPCPAAQVNLICFRAGGYPKPKCSSTCRSQDASAKYDPAGTKLVMADYYGPWGIHAKYPAFKNVEASCNWTSTRTEQLQKITYAVKSDGSNPTGGKFVPPHTWTVDTIKSGSSPLSPGATIPVEVEVVAADGPEMAGAKITNDCNMGTVTKNSECFGPTQGENLRNGIILVGVGSLLLCGPIACFCLCLAATNRIWHSVQGK